MNIAVQIKKVRELPEKFIIETAFRRFSSNEKKMILLACKGIEMLP